MYRVQHAVLFCYVIYYKFIILIIFSVNTPTQSDNPNLMVIKSNISVLDIRVMYSFINIITKSYERLIGAF